MKDYYYYFCLYIKYLFFCARNEEKGTDYSNGMDKLYLKKENYNLHERDATFTDNRWGGLSLRVFKVSR